MPPVSERRVSYLPHRALREAGREAKNHPSVSGAKGVGLAFMQHCGGKALFQCMREVIENAACAKALVLKAFARGAAIRQIFFMTLR